MAFLRETDSFSAQNITSRLLIGTATPAAAAGQAIVGVRLTGLNGAAAVLTLDATITPDGGSEEQADFFSDTKRIATDTTWRRTAAFVVNLAAGDVLKIYALSSNASDTSVSGDVQFYDGRSASEVVDVVSANMVQINGDATNGNNAHLQLARMTISNPSAPALTLSGVGLDLLCSGSANIGANLQGTVASVVGSVGANVNGKVLGGGGSTITGVGARADNRDGEAIATAAKQDDLKTITQAGTNR